MVKNNTVKLFGCILIVFVLTSQITVAVYAQDERPVGAVELKLNIPVAGLISEAGDVDWYRFNATAASSYVIEVFNLSLTMDTFITLYSTDGVKQLAWGASKIFYNFTAPGTYYVKVQHTDSTYGVGTYSIVRRLPRPPILAVTVLDIDSGAPIEKAYVRVYHPLTYRLLGENITGKDGVTTISMKSRGYHLVTVTAQGYNDIYGVTTLPDEGPNSRWAGLERIKYTGFVVSSAQAESIVTPGASNTLNILLYNVNATYQITLLNVTVLFPWYGLREGRLEGAVVITGGMPLTLPPNSLWTYSLPFRAPSDVRAYFPFSTFSSVSFYARAQAWRTTFTVSEGSGLKEIKSLTTATISPDTQAEQGFQTAISGVSMVPTIDPAAIARLEDVASRINDLSSKMNTVTTKLSEVSAGIGDVDSKLATLSSTLKTVSSSLDGVNRRLDSVSLQLGSSDDKLAALSSAVKTSNGKLDSVTSQLQSLNSGVSELSTRQQDANSKLDLIEREMANIRGETTDLLDRLFGDLKTLLYAIIGLAAVMVAVNTLYLAKISKQTPK